LANRSADPARHARPAQVATAAWAVAATLAAVTVVGWTAFSMVDAPSTAVARAREAATVRAAQARPLPDLPSDYLIAHQEYSPSTAIQGMGPYMQAVAVTGNEPRP
jgi:sigma-E factor negative regulatory protein RseA